MKKVLLTGISGYIGQHCALELLKHGYSVRGSLRNLSKKEHFYLTYFIFACYEKKYIYLFLIDEFCTVFSGEIF